MSFSLSFAAGFFLAEGEPYDRSDLALNAQGKPISVYSAIQLLQRDEPETWLDLAREVFGMTERPEFLTPEAVLDKIQETDTCDDLSSPVSVYIDPEGDFQVSVYDE